MAAERAGGSCSKIGSVRRRLPAEENHRAWLLELEPPGIGSSLSPTTSLATRRVQLAPPVGAAPAPFQRRPASVARVTAGLRSAAGRSQEARRARPSSAGYGPNCTSRRMFGPAFTVTRSTRFIPRYLKTKVCGPGDVECTSGVSPS